MTSFGYRLFTVSVYREKKHSPVNLKDCEGEHYKDIVARLLNTLSDPVVGDPPANPDESHTTESDDIRGKSALRLADIEVIDNTVQAKIWVGRIGSHEKAMSHDGSTDFDISDKAAINGFRVIFAFPEDGIQGILAVESISRSCPVSPLIKWLQHKSSEESYRKNKETNSVTPWWRPKIKGLADELRLAEMIEAGQAQSLVLVKKSVTPARIPNEREFEIRAPLVNGGKVKQVASLVRAWASQVREGDGAQVTSNSEAARQLATIISPEIKDLDLDDGWVVLADPDDQGKRINPSMLTDVFTYKLSEDRPVDTPEFYAEVRQTAMRLQLAARLDIEWPQP
ncbi:hypothetical protein ACFXN2_28365 [Streptomyces kronopolitis]|uniref:hypothetical protein n=1 Tax=Streptomyces kronopolitis TaxID=1612435 RepID=UPI003676120D